MNRQSSAAAALIGAYLKSVARTQGVPAATIASEGEIDALVLMDDADIPVLKGSYREIFFEKALAIKHGRIGLIASEGGLVEVKLFQPD
jgi:ribonuclease D